MTYRGDFNLGATVRFMWNTFAIAGESITRASNGTISVYKNGNTAQSTAGVTDTEDFDGLTGVHYVAIDTSADGTFYSTGSDFSVVLSGATVDGKSINAVLAEFSIENRSALRPTVAGRTLDVTSTGAAGIDWANVENPTTTVNLSGTNIDADQVVASVSGTVNANVTQISGDTTAADALEAAFDGTGVTLTNVVIPTVTTLTNTAGIADAVWDETAADHNTAGTTGNKLNAAGGASDPLLNNKDDYPDPDTIGNVLATLGSRPVNYIGSVNATSGDLPLRVGDTYTGSTPHGRVRISHDIAGFDLTAVTVTDIRLLLKPASEKANAAASALINVAAHSGSLAADEAEFEVSSTDTGKLVAGARYIWFASCLVNGVSFTWGEGTVTALAKGRP